MQLFSIMSYNPKLPTSSSITERLKENLKAEIQFCTSFFTQEQLKYCINTVPAGTEKLTLSVVITVISEGNLI